MWVLDEEPGLWDPAIEPTPLVLEDEDVGRLLEPLVKLEPVGMVRPCASWMVTIRRPGATVDVLVCSPPSAKLLLEAEAGCFNDEGVMVEVDDDLEDCEDGPRWVSLSCFKLLVSFHDMTVDEL